MSKRLQQSPPPDLARSWINRLRAKHLLMLIALEKTGSVRQASELLCITQPAGSKLLLDAERMFETRLFDRGPRGLTITEDGAYVVERAGHLIESLDQAKASIALGAHGITGSVRAGVLPVATARLIPEVVASLRQRAPGLRITVVEESANHLLAALRRGEVDLVIGRMTEPSELHDLTREPLYGESIEIVAGSDHPLATRRGVGLDETARWPWIFPPGRSATREHVERAWRRAGLADPPVPMETISVAAIAGTLRRTDCLATMPAAAAAIYLEAGFLARIDVLLPGEPPPIELIRLRREVLTGAPKRFAEEVRKVATRLATA